MNCIPEISVCIPAFNHQKYIGACIDSVLHQTLAPSEVVITDDCSTDGTVDVIRTYADPRIRLFRNKVNSGPSVAANNNLRHARGEYICLLASDDMFHPEKLARQADYLRRHPEVGLVFSSHRAVDEDGEPIEDSSFASAVVETDRPREAWLAEFFHGVNNLSAPTVMMRREVVERVGNCDPRLLQAQDFDLWIRAALHFDIHMLPEPLVEYRVRANHGNASAGAPDKQARTAWELTKVLQRFRKIDDEDLFFRIFPQARALRGRGLPLDALLAVQAVQAEEGFTRNFGLDLLYELLANPRWRKGWRRSASVTPVFDKFAALAADRWALDEAANWKAAHANPRSGAGGAKRRLRMAGRDRSKAGGPPASGRPHKLRVGRPPMTLKSRGACAVCCDDFAGALAAARESLELWRSRQAGADVDPRRRGGLPRRFCQARAVKIRMVETNNNGASPIPRRTRRDPIFASRRTSLADGLPRERRPATAASNRRTPLRRLGIMDDFAYHCGRSRILSRLAFRFPECSGRTTCVPWERREKQNWRISCYKARAAQNLTGVPPLRP